MQNFGGKTKSIMVFLKMAYIILSPETSRFFYFFFIFQGGTRSIVYSKHLIGAFLDVH